MSPSPGSVRGAPDLVPAELLEGAAGLDLAARVLARAFRAGRHRSPFTGSGEEFDRHRPYQQGDEPRHLDWRLYARSDRLHVRRYRESAAHPTWILVDASASMGFSAGGRVSKLTWGTRLAAVVAHLLLEGGDPVGLASIGDEPRLHLPARARPGHRTAIFAGLARLAAEGSGDPVAGVEAVADRMPRSGRLLLLSDLLGTPGEEGALASALGTVTARGGEAIALRIADPVELGLEIPGSGLYEDPERPGAFRGTLASPEAFRGRVAAHYADLRERLESRGVEFVPFTTELPLLSALFRWLGPR